MKEEERASKHLCLNTEKNLLCRCRGLKRFAVTIATSKQHAHKIYE